MSEDSDKGQNWSGTFQRLRAESVIFALLFYVFTQVPIDLHKAPFLPVEFPSGLPRGPVILLLFGFCCFFLTSWYLRFQRERSRADELIRHADILVGKVNHLKKGFPNWADDLTSQARGDGAMLRDVCQQLEIKIKLLLPLAGDVKRLGEEVRVLEDQRPRDATEVADKFLNFSGAIPEALDQLRTEYAGFQVHWNRIVGEMKSISANMPTVTADLEKTVNETVRRLEGVRSLIGREMVLVGYRLPFGFAVGLIALALPQAALDSAPTFAKFRTCIVDPSMSCLFRTDQPNKLEIKLKWRGEGIEWEVQ
uniref:hypothetical protein n=1 Tax=Ensifer adhaerens TaxID=106592 RepID=UPI003F499A6F